MLIALLRLGLALLRGLRTAVLGQQVERCPYCSSEESCLDSCPTRACPECGGLGAVTDYECYLGEDDGGNRLYGGKPCPRGCPAP